MLVPRRGMDDDPGRLVDDEEPVVLVDDAKRNVLGLELHRGGRRSGVGHRLSGAQHMTLARRPAVDRHVAGGDHAAGDRP